MIVSDAFRGKRYAVLGLARSGIATLRSLVASGAEVTAWDSREDARAQAGDGVTLADPMEIDLSGFDGVVVSPGVPLNSHPIANKCRDASVPVIGDIELFALARPSLPQHKVVGITGTNGKSTTTALVHHMLKSADIPTLMGGNIGLPILSQEPLPAGGVYVLELSSFQIDLTYTLDCDIAILLNITPDHLDRYDSFESYAASKWRLIEMQSEGHSAVISAWTDVAEGLAAKADLDQFVAWISPLYPEDQSQWPSLQGPHNLENAVAARTATDLLHISTEAIERGLRTYPGLAHRMERIGEFDGVLYVNDSKATNATSTAPALAAYPSVHWILGGLAKTQDLDACVPYYSHVRAAYTFGRDGPMLADILRPHLPVVESETLEQSVAKAHAAATAGDTVLLSPACASQDQFRDFEERGDCFREAVRVATGQQG